jgi:hypothetical protein
VTTDRTPRPRLPELEPHEARRLAEDHLGHSGIDADIPRATAYALLAIAAELAVIRREKPRTNRK